MKHQYWWRHMNSIVCRVRNSKTIPVLVDSRDVLSDDQYDQSQDRLAWRHALSTLSQSPATELFSYNNCWRENQGLAACMKVQVNISYSQHFVFSTFRILNNYFHRKRRIFLLGLNLLVRILSHYNLSKNYFLKSRSDFLLYPCGHWFSAPWCKFL